MIVGRRAPGRCPGLITVGAFSAGNCRLDEHW